MLKKILIGASIMAIGFIIKNLRNGEKMILEDVLLIGGIALAVIALKEWTDIPYDWGKHKNKSKDKERENLN